MKKKTIDLKVYGGNVIIRDNRDGEFYYDFCASTYSYT